MSTCPLRVICEWVGLPAGWGQRELEGFPGEVFVSLAALRVPSPRPPALACDVLGLLGSKAPQACHPCSCGAGGARGDVGDGGLKASPLGCCRLPGRGFTLQLPDSAWPPSQEGEGVSTSLPLIMAP